MTQKRPPTFRDFHSSERWLHIPSGITYRVAFECAGVCDMEPLHGNLKMVRRDVLQTSDCWQRVP